MTWWGELWRLAGVIAISGIAWFEIAHWQAANYPWWLWLDLGVGLFGLMLLRWRRSHPVLVNVVINLLAPCSASIGGPATLALMSLATRRRWREIIPISVLAFASGIAQISIMEPEVETLAFSIPFIMAIIAVTVGWGLYIGSRRELVAGLRERAQRNEAEQAAKVLQARNAERTRIAREMHDVMAHRISLVTMHAGALAYRDDLDAKQVKETAALIQQTSHQALEELREVLGLLREDAGDALPEPPQPEAADIQALVAETIAAGMTVRFDQDIDLPAVPTSMGRTLYRVTQESLTNARKHAPGVAVDLQLRGNPSDGVTFRISNPLPVGAALAPQPPKSGLGLVGLAERAALAGGRLDHRREGQSFVVEGWLPWPTS